MSGERLCMWLYDLTSKTKGASKIYYLYMLVVFYGLSLLCIIVLYLSNRVLFQCLHSLVLTLGGSGEFLKVMQTRDIVKRLHNCLEFSQRSSCLDEAM